MECIEKRTYMAWFDASLKEKTGRGAIAFTVISPKLELVREQTFSIDSMDSNLLEAVALFELLCFLVENNIKCVRIMGDNQGVISAIKSGKKVELYEEIREMMKQFEYCKLKWIPRIRNSYTDNLCKQTYKNGSNCNVFGNKYIVHRNAIRVV